MNQRRMLAKLYTATMEHQFILEGILLVMQERMPGEAERLSLMFESLEQSGIAIAEAMDAASEDGNER